jgi:glycosyltransferase involved in cell wall biosynthesis
MKSEPGIAFVIDALPSLGGAEKVLFTALEIFPQADVFTLVYNKRVLKRTPLGRRSVRTSFIDWLPLAHRQHRLFLPLMPYAIEQFDLRNYETIVSFSYAVAHGVRNFNGARHISYTFTPMRYAWMNLNINGTHNPMNRVMDQFMKAFRAWDQKAASHVHQFVAISQAVSNRIASAYQRDADIIYPPVDVDQFAPAATREDFYITVTRLVPHKRVDILVQAFSQLDLPLLIVGEGPERRHLASKAKPNIQFLGYQPDEQVKELLGKARGFVCATEEDFGIAIVEAQAAGCPVIAYGKGGALETVIDEQTGVFFTEQSPESLIEALQKFERVYSCFHGPDLVLNSHRFQKENFISRFKELIPGSQ